jgi:phospholipid/cholesterol/gamma-HCH transport system substrate-binding protein
MTERTMQFRVGVMLLAAILAAAVLALTFGGLPSLLEKTYTINVKFPSASGLTDGSPVRKSGIRIGEVSNIALASDDQVLVTLRISTQYPIHDDEVCRLRTSLLGDSSVEFEHADASARDSTARPTENKTGK